MKRFLSIKFISRVISLPIAVLVLHFFILSNNIYASIPSIDILMHLLGGGATAFCITTILFRLQKLSIVQHLDKDILYTLVVSLTCIIAVLWEICELVSDTFIMTATQIGVSDTLSDIVMGIIGSVVFLSIEYFKSRTSAYT